MVIPEEAVQAVHAVILPYVDDEHFDLSAVARAALEAAAPHMLADALHSYAAAGFTVCGLETGGAISRHDGYDGPAHRTTADDGLVTCADCTERLTK